MLKLQVGSEIFPSLSPYLTPQHLFYNLHSFCRNRIWLGVHLFYLTSIFKLQTFIYISFVFYTHLFLSIYFSVCLCVQKTYILSLTCLFSVCQSLRFFNLKMPILFWVWHLYAFRKHLNIFHFTLFLDILFVEFSIRISLFVLIPKTRESLLVDKEKHMYI